MKRSVKKPRLGPLHTFFSTSKTAAIASLFYTFHKQKREEKSSFDNTNDGDEGGGSEYEYSKKYSISQFAFLPFYSKTERGTRELREEEHKSTFLLIVHKQTTSNLRFSHGFF